MEAEINSHEEKAATKQESASCEQQPERGKRPDFVPSLKLEADDNDEETNKKEEHSTTVKPAKQEGNDQVERLTPRRQLLQRLQQFRSAFSPRSGRSDNRSRSGYFSLPCSPRVLPPPLSQPQPQPPTISSSRSVSPLELRALRDRLNAAQRSLEAVERLNGGQKPAACCRLLIESVELRCSVEQLQQQQQPTHRTAAFSPRYNVLPYRSPRRTLASDIGGCEYSSSVGGRSRNSRAAVLLRRLLQIRREVVRSDAIRAVFPFPFPTWGRRAPVACP